MIDEGLLTNPGRAWTASFLIELTNPARSSLSNCILLPGHCQPEPQSDFAAFSTGNGKNHQARYAQFISISGAESCEVTL